MSIELLNKEHLSVLKNSINSTKNRMRIVSPFIGFETSKLLVDCIKETKVECTIITRFYREDFLNHASSLEALKILIEAGVKVIALKDLHAKLYIFDNELVVLGSANFTMGGFRYNHELSLIIEDELELINQLSIYYDSLLNEIESSGDWLIHRKRIEDELKLVNELSKNRKDKSIKYKNTHQFGATVMKETEFKEYDNIEKIIRENINSGFEHNVWLKFVGTGNNRFEPNVKYTPERLNSNGKNVTCFPRNPRSIENGDTIYLSALSWDKNNTVTPMIIARAITKGFKAKNVTSQEDCRQYAWMSEYPYYIELYDIEILDAEISSCISLDRLIRELGCDLYPSTLGKQLSVAELKSRHYQKSHLRLTASAKQYIDKMFDDIGEKLGVIKYWCWNK